MSAERSRSRKGGDLVPGRGAGGRKEREKPFAINTGKSGCCGQAIRELKQEVKYLNNVVEVDHGEIKRLIKPTLGFKSMKTAYATVKGLEGGRSQTAAPATRE